MRLRPHDLPCLARLLGPAMILASALALAPTLALAQESGPRPRVGAHPAFERLKSLAGVWEGIATSTTQWTGSYLWDEEEIPKGEEWPTRVEYEVISAGSALLERLAADSPFEMISIYHRDGPALMMTHYCSSQNQPRLRTADAIPDLDVLRFHFVDATNINNTNQMYINELVIRFVTDDHIIQDWRNFGQLTRFEFHRVEESDPED